MNSYQKKLRGKKENSHKRPEDKSLKTKKVKMEKLKHTKKNAQFGMF